MLCCPGYLYISDFSSDLSVLPFGRQRLWGEITINNFTLSLGVDCWVAVRQEAATFRRLAVSQATPDNYSSCRRPHKLYSIFVVIGFLKWKLMPNTSKNQWRQSCLLGVNVINVLNGQKSYIWMRLRKPLSMNYSARELWWKNTGSMKVWIHRQWWQMAGLTGVWGWMRH